MNAHYMASEGVPIQLAIPKEGAVLGIDTVAIMKGSKRAELAYKFINAALDPQVQAEVAKFKKGSPVVTDAKLDPAIASLPGVFFFQAEDGIRDLTVTGVQTCALPI